MNYLVVDTDNFTGVSRDAFFGWVYTSNTIIHEAFLCGKENSAPKDFATKLASLCPKVKISICLANSIPEHADVLCGFSLGRIVEQSVIGGETNNVTVYIVSADKLVLSLVNTASEHGITSYAVSAADGMMTIRCKDEIIYSVEMSSSKKSPPQKRLLPDWAKRQLTEKDKKIGLVCDKVPTEESFSKPEFIPFPQKCSVVDVGSNWLFSDNGNNTGMINLAAWDSEKNGLYDKNVTFEYNRLQAKCPDGEKGLNLPVSFWTIRTNRARKTGPGKAIKVDGKLLTDGSQEVQITNGTRVDLGGFSFQFCTDSTEVYCRFDSDVEIAKQIELNLQACSKRLPWNLVEKEHIWVYNLKTKQYDAVKQDFTNAAYRTYLEIIKRFWKRFPTIQRHFKEFEEFENAFNFNIQEGRNLSDHASTGGPSDIKKADMVKFLFILNEELEKWDANHVDKLREYDSDEFHTLCSEFSKKFGTGGSIKSTRTNW